MVYLPGVQVMQLLHAGASQQVCIGPTGLAMSDEATCSWRSLAQQNVAFSSIKENNDDAELVDFQSKAFLSCFQPTHLIAAKQAQNT